MQLDFIRKEDDGTYEAVKGAFIDSTIVEAIEVSRATKQLVRVVQDGVIMLLAADSNPRTIRREFMRTRQGCIHGIIPPYPPSNLDHETELQDDRRRDEYEELVSLRLEGIVSYRSAELKDRLLAPFEPLNAEAWEHYNQRQSTSQGSYQLEFATRWARFMQYEMSRRVPLDQYAEATYREAALLPGASSQAAAVSTLVNYWKYGAQLYAYVHGT